MLAETSSKDDVKVRSQALSEAVCLLTTMSAWSCSCSSAALQDKNDGRARWTDQCCQE